MTITYPARKWADDDDETLPCVPTVIVSSRDGEPVPRVGAVARLAKLAEANGWTVRVTYALAAVPDRWHKNGNLARAAHMLASVALRLARGAVRGFAVWTNEDDEGWRFDVAYIGRERIGARGIGARLAVAP